MAVVILVVMCFGAVYGQFGFFPRAEVQYSALRQGNWPPVFDRRPQIRFNWPEHPYHLTYQNGARNNEYNANYEPNVNFVRFPNSDYDVPVKEPYIDNDNEEIPGFNGGYSIETISPISYENPTETLKIEYTTTPPLIVDKNENYYTYDEADDRFTNDYVDATTESYVSQLSEQDRSLSGNLNTGSQSSVIWPSEKEKNHRYEFKEEPLYSLVFNGTSIKKFIQNPTVPPKADYINIPIIKNNSSFNEEFSGGWVFPETQIAKTQIPPERQKIEDTTTAKIENEEVKSKENVLVMIPAGVMRISVKSDFNSGSDRIFKATCTTMDGGVGTCVLLAHCEPIFQLLKDVSAGKRQLNLEIKKASCGFEGQSPKVCCPHIEIPPDPVSTPRPVPARTRHEPEPAPARPEPEPAPTRHDSEPAPARPEPEPASTRHDSEPASTRHEPVPTRTSHEAARDGDSFLPQPPVCGISNVSASRVVGGQHAKLGDFPWMALLGYKHSTFTGWDCGGALISHRHVLTAAHCIYDLENRLYVVRLGELDLSRTDEAAPVDVLIQKMIKHEDYSPNHKLNDVGLLVLQQSITYTKWINPICLPQTEELLSRNFEGHKPFVAGWGTTQYRGRSSSQLQYVQLTVFSNEKCAATFASYKLRILPDKAICAGSIEDTKDACSGDSGGPLMQPVSNPKTYKSFMYMTGVVSFGIGCGHKNTPGVYSRVSEYMPWIISSMRANP